MNSIELKTLELKSKITSGAKLILSLEETTLSSPAPDEVIVEIEAAPINPSDLGVVFGPANLSDMRLTGSSKQPVLTMDVAPERLKPLSARLDLPLSTGNEGAGTVINAGTNVKHMVGKKVSMIGGGMYSQYRKIDVHSCMEIPDGSTPADGASMFINPLTALSMVEAMKREGHSALIHTAAASNLGQMLNKICLADGVDLVNIVRSTKQAAILKEIGAKYIVNSSQDTFKEELTSTIAKTGATIAFDATGGGKLANAILHAMETALKRNMPAFSIYGSTTHKQVYMYGSLDTSPTILDRGYGMAWSVGGFLLTAFLQKIGDDATASLKGRVKRELKTTFASHYTNTISLTDALQPNIVQSYYSKATGKKYLINPSL